MIGVSKCLRRQWLLSASVLLTGKEKVVDVSRAGTSGGNNVLQYSKRNDYFSGTDYHQQFKFEAVNAVVLDSNSCDVCVAPDEYEFTIQKHEDVIEALTLQVATATTDLADTIEEMNASPKRKDEELDRKQEELIAYRTAVDARLAALEGLDLTFNVPTTGAASPGILVHPIVPSSFTSPPTAPVMSANPSSLPLQFDIAFNAAPFPPSSLAAPSAPNEPLRPVFAPLPLPFPPVAGAPVSFGLPPTISPVPFDPGAPLSFDGVQVPFAHVLPLPPSECASPPHPPSAIASPKRSQLGDHLTGRNCFDQFGRDTTLSGDGTVVAASNYVQVFDWNGVLDRWDQRGEDNDLGGEENSISKIAVSANGSIVALWNREFCGRREYWWRR